jgi:hypothetical protein
VGDGDGAGAVGDFVFVGVDDEVFLRVDDRLDVVGEGLGDGILLVAPTSGVGGEVWARPLPSTVGAAASLPGTFGRIAATVDDPACSELVKVTTVAAATVVITAAAANLYSLVGGTGKLPGMRTSRQRHPPYPGERQRSHRRSRTADASLGRTRPEERA